MKKKKKILLLICFLACLFFSLWYDISHGTNIHKKVRIAFLIYVVANIVISVFVKRWIYIKEKIIGHVTFEICVIVVTIIPVMVHYVFFREKVVEEDVWLSFYGNYISFLGTVFFGYIVYRRDENNEKNDKLAKAKKLSDILDGVFSQMDLLVRCPDRVTRISYSEHWKEYYYEITGLVQKLEIFPIGPQKALERVFELVDEVNVDLKNGKKEEAIARYKKFKKNDQYSTSDFNYRDVSDLIRYIGYFYNRLLVIKPMGWNDTKVVKEAKEKLRCYVYKFYPIIELKIYNCLIKRNVEELKDDVIMYEVVDWLMSNPELYRLVDFTDEKRTLAWFFNEVCKRIEFNSEKLYKEGGVFRLKK